MSERVLSLAASNEYHLDSLTHRKSILLLFCTSLKTPDIVYLLYININIICRNTIFPTADFLGFDTLVFYLIDTGLESVDFKVFSLLCHLEEFTLVLLLCS